MHGDPTQPYRSNHPFTQQPQNRPLVSFLLPNWKQFQRAASIRGLQVWITLSSHHYNLVLLLRAFQSTLGLTKMVYEIDRREQQILGGVLVKNLRKLIKARHDERNRGTLLRS
ncbi:unnamed protein product [Malus baccata var. baccata]